MSWKEPLRKRDVPDDLGVLFPEHFLREVSSFGSFEKLLEESPWSYQGDVTFSESVSLEDFDAYIEETTDFSSWEQMCATATERLRDDPDRQRRHPRHETDPVEVTVEYGEREMKGELRDISRSGLRLKVEGELPEQGTIRARIPNPNNSSQTFVVRGVIRWKEGSDPCEIGVELTDKTVEEFFG